MANNFLLPRGQARFWTPELNQFYDTFVMEDDSVIVTTHIDIDMSAREARFGNNCSIEAAGFDGRSYGPNTYVPPIVNQCDSGWPGGHGPNGENGVSGRNVKMQIGLRTLGGLRINTRGGRGGNGGAGGIGGQGGGARCVLCRGGGGGPGGNGGNGGRGGDAGQITFIWSPLAGFKVRDIEYDAKDPLTNAYLHQLATISAEERDGAKLRLLSTALQGVVPPGLHAISDAGKGGDPGSPGGGGRGGDGASCGLYGMDGGDPGGPGYWGIQGRPGASKTPIVTLGH